ncbi:MAG: c(7)-type cytochrome triheme domain-containing protein [Thermodesulfobacteriota bacterium]
MKPQSFVHRLGRPGLLAMALLLLASPAKSQYWDFPPLPPPHAFGNLLMDRVASGAGAKPVVFSHWSHRLRYSCRVCHFELDFAFAAGTTEVTEADNRNGLFCGACHNGKEVFGHQDPAQCGRCHSGDQGWGQEAFGERTAALPRTRYGNRIDWVRAAKSGKIRPRYSLFNEGEAPMEFVKQLELKAEWLYVPPAFFPHDAHAAWLDCGNCHPDIFNIKKKGTQHFEMKYILEGRFCGVCHIKVAFPLQDCKRCHPAIHMVEEKP